MYALQMNAAITNHGWLDSWHTFFVLPIIADRNFMGFSALQVINERLFIAEGRVRYPSA